MDNKESFDKDEVTRNLLQKAGLEEPSWDFTSGIMVRVQTAAHPEVFRYKPVISRKGWIFICMSVILFYLLIIYWPVPQAPVSGDLIPFSIPENIFRNFFTGFSAKTMMLPSMPGMAGIIAAGWMLFALDRFIGRKKTLH